MLYQVRLITNDYRICAKIGKAPVPYCLNDKSLAGHNIIGLKKNTEFRLGEHSLAAGAIRQSYRIPN